MFASTPRFALGQCLATQGALGALEDNKTFPIIFLKRHESGDCGDLGAEDKAMNEAAIQPDPEDCDRILSMYILPDGQKSTSSLSAIVPAQPSCFAANTEKGYMKGDNNGN